MRRYGIGSASKRLGTPGTGSQARRAPVEGRTFKHSFPLRVRPHHKNKDFDGPASKKALPSNKISPKSGTAGHDQQRNRNRTSQKTPSDKAQARKAFKPEQACDPLHNFMKN